MYRSLALACLASLTSGCLMTLAAGLPLNAPTPLSPDQPTLPASSTETGSHGGSLATPSKGSDTGDSGQTLRQQLQGAWLYETGDGSDMVLNFQADGTLLGHPADTDPSDGLVLHGEYQLSGEVLTFAFPGIAPVSGKLSFSADRQTMIMGNAALRRYRPGSF